MMRQDVKLQPAYILHRRAYRETSFLLDVFSQEHGRFSAIAKGVRKAKSASQGLLQPFVPLLVSWVGRGELMTLTHAEACGPIQSLQGDRLFTGFYLNELLTILMQKWDAQAAIFSLYTDVIAALQSDVLNEKALRLFEKKLLEELGYGLLLKKDNALLDKIDPAKHYRFVPDHGFVETPFKDESSGIAAVFSGQSLLAIADENWDIENCMQDAKRLSRYLLRPLIGQRTIHSRKLFVVPSGLDND